MLSFISIFLVKSDFSNFQYCQNFKTWIFKGKKKKNIGENPAERDEHSFLCQNSEIFIFLNLVRGSEIMKV